MTVTSRARHLESSGAESLRGSPIFEGAADFDLELMESRTLDGHTQELVYRPILRG